MIKWGVNSMTFATIDLICSKCGKLPKECQCSKAERESSSSNAGSGCFPKIRPISSLSAEKPQSKFGSGLFFGMIIGAWAEFILLLLLGALS